MLAYSTFSRQMSDALSFAFSRTQPSHASAASHAAQQASAVSADLTLVVLPPRRPLPGETWNVQVGGAEAVAMAATIATSIFRRRSVNPVSATRRW